MTIDLKDEYGTLRQEMLGRFDRIHDTAKYGTGAFIAFMSFYYKSQGFDDLIALVVLQLLVAIMGMSSLRLYYSIYNVATYISITMESNSEAKWHRMSRQLSAYMASFRITEQSLENLKSKGLPDDVLRKLESMKSQRLLEREKFEDELRKTIGEPLTKKNKSIILKHSRCMKIRWWRKLPFPLGNRWGGDSAQLAILLLVLIFLGVSVVWIKAQLFSVLGCLNSSEILLLLLQPLLIFSIVLIICNLIVVYKLWWGIVNFVKDTDKEWKKFSQDYKGENYTDNAN